MMKKEQPINILFPNVENEVQRTNNERYFLPNIEIKDHNVRIDAKKLS